MTFKDKLIIYLYNKSSRVDLEFHQQQHNLRYRVPDEVDYMEAIIAKVRRDMYNEIAGEILSLLKLRTTQNE